MQNETLYKKRLSRLAPYFKKESLDCLIIEDTEGRRNSGLLYFTGHPSDAVLLIFSDLKTVLIPWDEILAEKHAIANQILPLNKFKSRDLISILPQIFNDSSKNINTIEISGASPYPLYTNLNKNLGNIKIICKQDGIDKIIADLRKTKDEQELEIYQKTSKITDSILKNIISGLKNKTLKTESDIALLIEKKAREAGAEGTGFESLIAGPSRSFAIHSHPAYTNADVLTPGLTIMDFGIKYQGYTSDVTFSLGYKINKEQEKMIGLVKEAYDLAVDMLKPGISTLKIAKAVDDFFETKGFSMPHALGHGIGLETHESPILRNRESNEELLKENMIITIEPGLYSKENGGVRLENDFLITKSGYKKLTNSLILILQD